MKRLQALLPISTCGAEAWLNYSRGTFFTDLKADDARAQFKDFAVEWNSRRQGLTLVHFSACSEHFLWNLLDYWVAAVARGPRRKPGASSETLTRLFLGFSGPADVELKIGRVLVPNCRLPARLYAGVTLSGRR